MITPTAVHGNIVRRNENSTVDTAVKAGYTRDFLLHGTEFLGGLR
jgi:hypothetical protein